MGFLLDFKNEKVEISMFNDSHKLHGERSLINMFLVIHYYIAPTWSGIVYVDA